tara:strand:- start:652 stop:1581 length:930 start_codon:yes stop_codon:yes gene_type:complete
MVQPVDFDNYTDFLRALAKDPPEDIAVIQSNNPFRKLTLSIRRAQALWDQATEAGDVSARPPGKDVFGQEFATTARDLTLPDRYLKSPAEAAAPPAPPATTGGIFPSEPAATGGPFEFNKEPAPASAAPSALVDGVYTSSMGRGRTIAAPPPSAAMPPATGEPFEFNNAPAPAPAAPPAAMPSAPEGDFGLPPAPEGDFGLPPAAMPEQPLPGEELTGPRTYGPVPFDPRVGTMPPPVGSSPFAPPVGAPPFAMPDYGSYGVYAPPVFQTAPFADTRAAGYDAAVQRFANSPFVRPEGIGSLQLGNLKL